MALVQKYLFSSRHKKIEMIVLISWLARIFGPNEFGLVFHHKKGAYFLTVWLFEKVWKDSIVYHATVSKREREREV